MHFCFLACPKSSVCGNHRQNQICVSPLLGLLFPTTGLDFCASSVSLKTVDIRMHWICRKSQTGLRVGALLLRLVNEELWKPKLLTMRKRLGRGGQSHPCQTNSWGGKSERDSLKAGFRQAVPIVFDLQADGERWNKQCCMFIKVFLGFLHFFWKFFEECCARQIIKHTISEMQALS